VRVRRPALQPAGRPALPAHGYVLSLDGESAEAGAKAVGIFVRDELLDFLVRLLPDGNGACQQISAFGGELENAAAMVRGAGRYLDQAAAFERLQGGGERGPIHAEQGCHGADGRGLGAIERHQEGELAVGQAEGTKHLIESPGQGSGGALDVKAKAAIPDQKGGFIRECFFA
jgi:hypothetical protein